MQLCGAGSTARLFLLLYNGEDLSNSATLISIGTCSSWQNKLLMPMSLPFRTDRNVCILQFLNIFDLQLFAEFDLMLHSVMKGHEHPSVECFVTR